MTHTLPIASTWYRSERITDTITRIDEPHVHEFLRANVWHVRGRDRDLVVDAGLGVASMREHLPELFANDPVLVVTHAHLDHAGGAHEFDDFRMHRAELSGAPIAASLRGPELAELLGLDEPDMPALLLDAVPSPEFDLDDYSLPAVPITHPLSDDERIDLGDSTFRVLHLPGHTPGSVGLFDIETGTLFSGDVLYDDVLLDELHGSSIADYVRSMMRLRGLPVRVVYPGHGEVFDGRRMIELIDAYVDGRAPRA
ncbi:MBL fold metallo-hydrolase [Agromyces neolithicus]|uniref:MBL fold metallo-hydrolase n=1 Tax=Agromyces neolithicus TaxID=269420 RepID=A0ABN2M7Q1_9MICO